jgi:hypothetical protein
MSDPIERGTLWRVTPTASAKRLIEQVARDEDRSIASTITRLLAEAVDRRNLDAALRASGLDRAVRTLELAAVTQHQQQIMPAAPVSAEAYSEAVDIEPRRYRKTAAEPAPVES